MQHRPNLFSLAFLGSEFCAEQEYGNHFAVACTLDFIFHKTHHPLSLYNHPPQCSCMVQLAVQHVCTLIARNLTAVLSDCTRAMIGCETTKLTAPSTKIVFFLCHLTIQPIVDNNFIYYFRLILCARIN